MASVWHRQPHSLPKPIRAGGEHADVIIVGAGITGLTAGIKLLEAGCSVTVFEQKQPGSGTTGHSSAHLTTLIDTDLSACEKQFSAEANRQLVDAMRGAIDQIEQWSREFEISCGFARVPAYYFAEDVDGAAFLSAETEAAKRAGLSIQKANVPFLETAIAAAFRLEDQAIFDPLAYVTGLARQFEEKGGRLIPGTPIFKVEDGCPCSVEVPGGTMTAEHVILATHTPIGRSVLHAELIPQRSYLLAAELTGPCENALYWDCAEPYHYARRIDRPGQSPLILIGGADHKTGEGPSNDPYAALEIWLRKRFPAGAVVRRWSAQLYTPIDGYPFVGRPLTDSHIFVGTGYAGDGLTLGTVAGGLLADLVLDRNNPLAALFHPSRIPVKAASRAVQFNLATVKHLMTGASGSITPRPGEGSVHRSDHELWADYREPDGTLHRFSARCPHMGCILQWNPLEHSWDCPCHGGRFTAMGQRLEGPPGGNMRRKDRPQS